MALVAALEADLRALSAEARRRYPAVKDGAEHAILKLRSSSSASDLSSNEDILRIFLMACGVRNTKLSVIGLSCLQKLISHDAVEPSSLKEILDTLKDHSEMAEENIQLKTLQTILIIFQSRLHPETEENMVLGLSICLRLLDNNRLPSVYNTAAATFRQAVAMIFDQVVSAESLPMLKYGSSSQTARTGSVTGDLSQNINSSEYVRSPDHLYLTYSFNPFFTLSTKMALVAALEADLRALSAEARRRYPAVKDGAEHAILKLRSQSSASDLSSNEDILRIFLMACGVRNTKLSVIGLSCLQKLISHDAVEPSSLKEILDTLKDHSEMAEENIQLKTLQTILIIFQSRLHPETEENMVLGLSICLRLLDNNRLPSVYNTAAATFRQAVAMIFDQVVSAESLPMLKYGSSSKTARTGSVTGDLSQNINSSESLEKDVISGRSTMRDTLSETGKLGVRLLEDLTASAAGGSVLRHQICSLLMTSLRTSSELEGEMVEPYFRRLVLRSVAHIIRLYSSSLITECEVFLNMLVKATFLDLPLWHRILVLEILRGFCVEARTLRILFQNFDMNPKNTNVVESMVKALARVVSSIQVELGLEKVSLSS
ncbi:hypothetical protein F2Q70_00018593 [Brassica cretica]|uniref:Mon2/Sec7/BIG1-like dimerisation and cyclophilin-binding domain-containing protein n=1 Tax=Brassica cretica TaxID=69181 RepID=A0A8S9I536_BRACR|nr:hypothetical protein F2Q70_00018593 [Brassica cretica]